ncbi:MAG: energy transducer TonB [Vicinamibacterales bacterium]
MNETQEPRHHVNASAGHLEVRIDDAHPVEMSFLFEQRQSRVGPAAVASLVYHIIFVAAIVFAVRYGSYHPGTATFPQEQPDYSHIVWLNEPGPGGGGGGGGNRMKEPPRKAQAPGKDKLTVQVEKPPQLEVPQQAKLENPLEQLNIPANSLADAQQSLPGAIEALPGASALSLGSGSGGGSGTGTGTGIGPGTGSGLGPGSGGGTGGGVYQVGNGVTSPVLLFQVKPGYTSDGMRAKAQGTVVLECVIREDGSVGDVRVIQSFKPDFGLNEEAMKAAKQWRFIPGKRLGKPVSVYAKCELDFNMR